ncbi:MAG: hypothetical protein ACTHMT_00975 [Verrucomicrobiota bacterium]
MIKFVFRWAFRLLVLAIVLVVSLILLKDTIARTFMEKRIRNETGFEVKIGRMEVALLRPVVSLDHLKLYNPPQFGGGLFVDIPDLHLEYKPTELRGVQLKLLRLDLKELNIVLDAAGQTNLVDFLNRAAPGLTPGPGGKTSSDQILHGVEMLNLSIGSVSFIDLRNPKRNQKFQLGIKNEVIQNVRSEQDIAAILFRALLRAGITVYLDEPTVQRPQQSNRFETSVRLKKR